MKTFNEWLQEKEAVLEEGIIADILRKAGLSATLASALIISNNGCHAKPGTERNPQIQKAVQVVNQEIPKCIDIKTSEIPKHIDTNPEIPEYINIKGPEIPKYIDFKHP